MPTLQQDSEQEIERLVRELGQIFRMADPEKQPISKSSPQPSWIKSLFLRENVHASPNVKNAVTVQEGQGKWGLLDKHLKPGDTISGTN